MKTIDSRWKSITLDYSKIIIIENDEPKNVTMIVRWKIMIKIGQNITE